jgi:hypothetical protein
MKYEFFPLSLGKVSEPSIHFTMDSAEAIETSIMRLLEENAALRLLAAQLNSELVLARARDRQLWDRRGREIKAARKLL